MSRTVWTREELILVLDLYLKNREDLNSISAEVFEAYSNFCRRLHQNALSQNSSFRSPRSIYLRLQNYRNCDPYWQKRGHKGLQSGQTDHFRKIWAEFHKYPEDVSQIADEIRQAILKKEYVISKLDSETQTGFVNEGGRQLRIHCSRERKPQRIPKLKAFKLAHDHLFCEVCGGDFAHYDEPVRERVFEVHHDVPLATASHQVETKLDDLSVLCANCHRAIHGYDQIPTIEEMRENLRRE